MFGANLRNIPLSVPFPGARTTQLVTWAQIDDWDDGIGIFVAATVFGRHTFLIVNVRLGITVVAKIAKREVDSIVVDTYY